MLLVRPDGSVAWRGDGLDVAACRVALGDHLHSPPASAPPARRQELPCPPSPPPPRRIEAVDVPFGDIPVPALVHLPPGHREGDRLPCLVMIGGMDAFTELQINGSADRFLRRGFAVLMLVRPPCSGA